MAVRSLLTLRLPKAESLVWIPFNATHLPYRRDRVLRLLFFISILVFCSLFFVWSRLLVIQQGYQISEALQIEKNLREKNQILRSQLAQAKSPERLESQAKLIGLIHPGPKQVTFVK